MEVGGTVAEVEDGESCGASFEGSGPDFDGAFREDAFSLMAKRILIDGENLGVGEDGFDIGRHEG